MAVVSKKSDNGQMSIALSGRVDSTNSPQVKEQIEECLQDFSGGPLVIDADDLEYLSSAGLRILLQLRKKYADLRVINVNSEVYEIFDMTGFTQMMTIEKAYRVVSIEGCEVIGQGANGTVYRIDRDNVVKVYNDADALDDIQHEREVAKQALILGIPTAISYDVVRVGDSYGSVFELLDAKSFSKILSNEPEKLDWCVDEYVRLLKKIHGTLVPEGTLPDMKETVDKWVSFMKDYLPETYYEKLKALTDGVPHDDHMIHGDYHTKNIELTGDEVLLIDMDTLAVGHPVFELASMYNSFLGFSEYNHEAIKKFQGFDYELSQKFWNKVLRKYLGTEDEARIRDVEDKARIVGYTRMIRRSIRRGGLETQDGKAEIDLWMGELKELLDRVDTLTFESEELEIEADIENLPEVMSFIEKRLEKTDCSLKDINQISVAAEEIFSNISHYAYAPETGAAYIRVETSEDPITVTLTFMDGGMPYDPLSKEDPDVALSADEREIGGLGIFLVKNIMDDIEYKYENGKNILILKKEIQK